MWGCGGGEDVGWEWAQSEFSFDFKVPLRSHREEWALFNYSFLQRILFNTYLSRSCSRFWGDLCRKDKVLAFTEVTFQKKIARTLISGWISDAQKLAFIPWVHWGSWGPFVPLICRAYLRPCWLNVIFVSEYIKIYRYIFFYYIQLFLFIHLKSRFFVPQWNPHLLHISYKKLENVLQWLVWWQ